MKNKELQQEGKVAKMDKVMIWLMRIIIFILALRIISYFTLFPSSLGLTRVVKVLVRCGLTASSLMLLWVMITHFKPIKWNLKSFLVGGLYMLYALMGTLSLLWTAVPGFTVIQLFMLWESIAFAVFFGLVLMIFVGQATAYSLTKILYASVAVVAAAVLIGTCIDPDSFYRYTHGGTVRRLGGFMMNPNELGLLMVVGTSMVLIHGKYTGFKWIYAVIIIFEVVALLLTQSRSSLGAMIIISFIFLVQSPYRKLAFSGVVVMVLSFPILFQTIIVKQGDMQEVMSMTGRLPFWTDLIQYGLPESPWFGFGFMSITSSPYTRHFMSVHAYAAEMTHNTFIQVLINLGWIGAFITGLQLFFTFIKTFWESNYHQSIIIFMLIPLIINSITEFGIFGEANYGILFYHLIIVILTIEVKKKQLYEIAQ